jgi:ketosteroid isomerase-like protein
MRRYESATNAHDLEAVLNLIADDAVYLFSNQSSHFGKPSIRRAIETNFAAIKNESYRIEGLIWLASSEDVAACAYEFHWTGEVDGKPASGHGRGTTILRRASPTWQVAHEHLSSGRLR